MTKRIAVNDRFDIIRTSEHKLLIFLKNGRKLVERAV